MDEMILQAVTQVQASGEQAALVTIIGTKGSTPCKPGVAMLVKRTGEMTGTIGGGCAEADVRRRALSVLDAGRPATYIVNMTNDTAAEEGMVCGGTMEVFIQLV